mmetsp:Transcript_36700/g.96917  ORF Transcript_36700/g.96917 Transcript_36700/m.96917 type:complete len:152 (+) Transcript_36700:7824-8279(+)
MHFELFTAGYARTEHTLHSEEFDCTAGLQIVGCARGHPAGRIIQGAERPRGKGSCLLTTFAIFLFSEKLTLVGVFLCNASNVLNASRQGYAGPPVNLDGVSLSPEQQTRCKGGLDKGQLKFLKAQECPISCFESTTSEFYVVDFAQFLSYL